MRKSYSWYLRVLLVLAYLTTWPVATLVAANLDQDVSSAPVQGAAIQDFDQLASNTGWVSLAGRLFWTTSGGNVWSDITPPGFVLEAPHAVMFLDLQQGWVVESRKDEQNVIGYWLAHTYDSGQTWQLTRLGLFQPGDVAAYAQTLSLYFLDANTGWLVVRRATSANFDVGALFKTVDGGATWTRLTIPIGAPVFFLTPTIGWTAGGADGAQLYRTEDGGQTWSPESLPGVQNDNWRRLYQLPRFIDMHQGVFLVRAGETLEFYSTDDGGTTWRLAVTQTIAPGLDATPQLPWSLSDARQALVFVAQTRRQIALAEPSRPAATALALPGKIVALRMATAIEGWAYYQNGSCVPRAQAALAGPICRREAGLLQTNDGGQRWTDVPLPLPVGPVVSQVETLPSSTHNQTRSAESLVQTFTGHGFDTCEIPTLAALQNWSTQSPYRAVNLYIGGSSRGCGNPALTAAYLSQLSQQGWKFIPTWVGPQAACSGYSSRMNYDPPTAYSQGVTEATAALNVAAILGLARPDRSGALIYYDLEAYDVNNGPCREAAQAFIAGWSMQLQTHNSQAGVYGSSCGSGLSHFANLAHVPDAIWPAYWIYSSFTAGASVWGVACLSDGAWVDHQRILQYAGGHQETWGDTTLNIDSNVLEGRVSTVGAATQSYVVEPAFSPAPGSTCGAPGEPATAWYPLPSYAGHAAFATLNATTVEQSSNSAYWPAPPLPCRTTYAVEALIVNHLPIVWCQGQQIQADTSNARYLIQHVNGVTPVSLDQKPLADAWALLGTFDFDPDVPGGVSLTDVTGEPFATASISFSAMRFTPVVPCATQLYTPTALTVIPVSTTQLRLQWQDDNSDEIGFKVERSADGQSGWAVRVTLPANTTIYTDTGLTPGTTYYYRLAAFDAAGDSGYSDIASATTLAGDSTYIYFAPASVSVSAHTSVTITLMISNTLDLGAFDYTISFSPAVVTVTQVTLGDFLGSTNRMVTPLGPNIDNIGGTVNLGAFSQGSTPGPDGGGALAYIQLRAQAGGATSLHFMQNTTTDTHGLSLPTMAQDGRVTVVVCLGDFNGNGQVDISDIQTIANLWRIRQDSPLYETRFDLNGNGEIDISDIQTVANRWRQSCASGE